MTIMTAAKAEELADKLSAEAEADNDDWTYVACIFPNGNGVVKVFDEYDICLGEI